MRSLLVLILLTVPSFPQGVSVVVRHRNTTVSQVATPTYDHDTGSYVTSVTVAISDATGGASIFYCAATGSNCNPVGGTSYTVPVNVVVDQTHLCSYATHSGMTDSATKCATYTITSSGFPFTSILDNFNRADVGPPPSADWNTMLGSGHGEFAVISNQLQATTVTNGYAADYYNLATYGPNAEVYITVVTVPATNGNISVWLRCTNCLDTTPTGYYLTINKVSGAANDTWTFRRMVTGVATVIGSCSNQEISNGDGYGFSAVGSTLTAYYKASGGSWAQECQVTDGNITGAGYLALTSDQTTPVFDNFGGGTIP